MSDSISNQRIIRVLHILQRMEAAGTQTFLMNLYRNINRSKLQFDFLVVYKEDQFYDNEIKELGGHIYKFSFREDFNLPKFQRELTNFFREHQEYEIVHCHAYTVGYLCLKAARNAGISVRIAHSHSSSTLCNWTLLPKLFMQRLYTKYATDLYACSNEAGRYLFKNRQFKVIHNAISTERFIIKDEVREMVRKELDLNDKFVVGHVGRLHQAKNHEFLLSVFQKIKEKKLNAELILVGDGPLEDKIRKRVKAMGLFECVHFLGARSDVERIYQAFDIFIFPSLFEGLGIVVIEAQTSGLPCLVSEAVPEEAVLTDLVKRLPLSRSAEDWAKEALDMIEKSAPRHSRADEVAAAGYDIRTSAKELEEMYRGMVENAIKTS